MEVFNAHRAPHNVHRHARVYLFSSLPRSSFFFRSSLFPCSLASVYVRGKSKRAQRPGDASARETSRTLSLPLKQIEGGFDNKKNNIP